MGFLLSDTDTDVTDHIFFFALAAGKLKVKFGAQLEQLSCPYEVILLCELDCLFLLLCSCFLTRHFYFSFIPHHGLGPCPELALEQRR